MMEPLPKPRKRDRLKKVLKTGAKVVAGGVSFALWWPVFLIIYVDMLKKAAREKRER